MQDISDKISIESQLVDETFNLQNCLNYNLSVLIGFSQVAYAVLDIKKNKYIVLKDYSLNNIYDTSDFLIAFGELIKIDPILKEDFKSTNFGIINRKSTIVPEPLWDKNKLKEHLAFNHSLNQEEIVRTDSIKSLCAKNIFAISQNLYIFLEKNFSLSEVKHFSTSLIETLLITNKNKTSKKIIIHVQQKQFEILVIDGDRLCFYNSFNYQTKEDFIYYILFVSEQLKLNPEQRFYEVCGFIEKNSELYNLLYKYIKNVIFIDRNDRYTYSYKFDEIDQHRYYNLFNLCG